MSPARGSATRPTPRARPTRAALLAEIQRLRAALEPAPPAPCAAPTTAEALLAAIRRLYHQLQALPTRDQPTDTPSRAGRTRRGSLAYQALEAQIRMLAGRYWRLTSGHTITHAGKSTVLR